jgi:hypothetical protein
MKTHRVIAYSFAFALFTALLFAADPVAAKGHRTFQLTAPATLAGQTYKADNLDVKWESHSPEATVVVSQGKASKTVPGKFVTAPYVAESDAIGYKTDDKGDRTIVELQFKGSSKILSFDPAVVSSGSGN